VTLDKLGQVYGIAPHELTRASAAELAFDWAVYTKANAK